MEMACHLRPSQCWVSGCPAPPLWVSPTAQTSLLETAATPVRAPTPGLGTTCQCAEVAAPPTVAQRDARPACACGVAAIGNPGQPITTTRMPTALGIARRKD